LKEVRVEDAIGMVLAHDLTRIVPGECKGRVFKKGHVIREEDIPMLLDIGKQHIYILDLKPGELHEDDAALRLTASIKGDHLSADEPHEGKVTLKSTIRGLLSIDEEALFRINSIGEIAIVTKKSGTVVDPGTKVAGLRAIPLVIEEEKIVQAERIAKEVYPLITVKPFAKYRVGVVTTGSEILTGRIEDRFGPRIREKLTFYGSEVIGQKIVGDQVADIQTAIKDFLAEGVDMIICTGGMSVDPDDRTPGAIRGVATEVVSYGMPVLPGSMMMFAYIDKIPVFGLPGCVIYDDVTSFDLLLPRVLAGETITREQIAKMGHGGLL
jgi:molybdenum cofactor synthesis domain-containing protein